MKVTDRLEERGLCVGVTLKEKDGIIDILAALQQKCGNTERTRQLKRDIYYAEEQASFAIGGGVAICRVKSKAVKRPLLTAVTAPAGVDLDAPDGERSRLIVLSALPEGKEVEDPAARLQALLLHADLREQLMAAADEATFLGLLKMAEEGQYSQPAEPKQETPLILAVIHSEEGNEAAAQLQLAAARLGMLLRLEGPDGPAFSAQELMDSAGVLLLGNGLKEDRFHGKPVLEAAPGDGIHRPEHLLRAVQSAPVHHKKPDLRRPKSLLRVFAGGALLPPLLFSAGIALMIGRLCVLFGAPDFLADALETVGIAALSTTVPLIAGQIGFHFARWNGMAAAICAGVVLGRVCGGVWAALGCGLAAGWLMRLLARWIGRLPKGRRVAEWCAPVVGALLLGTLAVAAGRLPQLAADGFQWIAAQIGFPWLRALLFGAAAALDPGGPLYRGAALMGETDELLRNALGAGSLAFALGISVFAVLSRKIESAQRRCGLAAFPAGIVGSSAAAIPFAAADPFRVCPAGIPGAGLAGALAVLFGSWLPAGLIGAALVCALLFWVYSAKEEGEKSAHKVK